MRDPASSGEDLVFAMRSIRMGLSFDKPDDWKNLGVDRDCLASRADGTFASCVAKTADVLEDGLNGRDNGFGRNVGGAMRTYGKIGVIWTDDLELQENTDIAAGKRGWLLRIENFGGRPNDPLVRASFYRSRGTVTEDGQPTAVRWDGNDKWSLDPDTLLYGNPRWVDDNAYVANNAVVAKMPNGLRVVWEITFSVITATVNEAYLVIRLGNDYSTVEGYLSALWPAANVTEEIGNSLRQHGFCPGDPRRDLFIQNITNMYDARSDFSVSPDLPCDAISLSYGFSGVRAKLGPIADPSPPPPDPCDKADSGP